MKRVTLIFLLLSVHCNVRSQETIINNRDTTAHQKEKQRGPLSMTLSYFNHSVSVPFHNIISEPLHPGVQAGIEGRYSETNRSKFFQTLNMGMFRNIYNGTGFYLNTELAYRFKHKTGIFAETLFGLGYLRTYHPTDIYELNSSGTYEQVKDNGFSSPLLSFALGLGYDIASKSSFSFSPFIRYESLFQTKYSPELDVFPQSTLHIGVRVNKKRTK